MSDQQMELALKPWQHQAIQQCLELYINPYVEKRQLDGTLPMTFILTVARVIFFPDSRGT